MRYWVLSPNIGGPYATKESLQNWKQLTLRKKVAFMGWPADRKGPGHKFATEYGAEEIIILIAYRDDWIWNLVAVGKVASEAIPDDRQLSRRYGEEYGYGTHRRLRPFVRLPEDPASSRLSLEHTSPDRLTNIKALVELTPEERSTDFRLCERLRAIIRRQEDGTKKSTAERTNTERDAALEAQEDRAGYQADPKVRKAIETDAMEKAKRHYTRLGYGCEDTSKHKPFDLRCSKGKSLIYVEVKGTQNWGREIIITEGELRHMEKNSGKCELFLLKGINIAGRSAPKASAGDKIIFRAARILKARRQPTQYRVTLPNA